MYRVLLLGELDVGITSFIALTEDGFHVRCRHYKHIRVRGQYVKLEFDDASVRARTANDIVGTRRYQEAHLVIIFYDITNQHSLQSVPRWLGNVDRSGRKNVHKILIGNKADLETERPVDYRTAQEFAEELCLPFLEISCRTSLNITQSCTLIDYSIEEIMDRHPPYHYPVMVPKEQTKCLLS